MKKKNRRHSLSRGAGLLIAATICASLVPSWSSLCRAQEFSDMAEPAEPAPFEESETRKEPQNSDDLIFSEVTSKPSLGPALSDELLWSEEQIPVDTLMPEGYQEPDEDGFGYEFGYEYEDTQMIPGSPEDRENPRQSLSTLDGIDISNWQKTIDLDQVEADFIICKATGGNGFKDKSFDRFARKILESGRLFGFYHYANDFGYEGSPEEEAAFFYAQTEQYIGQGIPILDYEDPDLLRSGSEWAYRFLEAYQRLSGVKCMLYTSSHYTRSINWSAVADAGYPLWVANYGKNEEQEGYRKTDETRTDGLGTGKFETYYMHQYSSRGKLEGYDGHLDLNKFYGSVSDWQQLMIPQFINRPMYRVYNLYTGEHFYTGSRSEFKALVAAGWQDEGTAWIAPKDGKNVYRLLNPHSGDHHYTTEVKERDDLITAGWENEGIGWVSEDPNRGLAVYRIYNPNAETGSHHFTMDYNEIETLVSFGWSAEGIAWYALDPEMAMEEMRAEFSVIHEGQEFYRNFSKF